MPVLDTLSWPCRQVVAETKPAEPKTWCLQEVMIEHGMRIACVASFNFAGFHELMTSNMETGQQAMGMPADKWRSVAVSFCSLFAHSCLLFSVIVCCL